MKIQKAVRAMMKDCNEDSSNIWIRPISWSGTGSAITIEAEDGAMIALNYEHKYYTPNDFEMLEDWEIVTTHQLLKEMWSLPKVETSD